MLCIIDGSGEKLAMTGRNIHLSIKVHPNARQKKIQKIKEGEYKIHVLSPPAEGKANSEVIDMVASHFHLPRSRVKIVRGMKSRKKTVILEYES
jgi:uncharacterized protein (TIGR00251 family)